MELFSSYLVTFMEEKSYRERDKILKDRELLLWDPERDKIES